MTLLFEGTLVAKEYCLYKEGSEDYLKPTALSDTGNKATFLISSVEWHTPSIYWCDYISTNGMLQKSNVLELVVTGERIFTNHRFCIKEGNMFTGGSLSQI
ncbi:leukocyte immunoglobulin-like receptor subfamily A member 6 [Sigmodon hispidus]